MKNILSEIQHERTKQDDKWGEQNHNTNKWLVILGEEYGEVCKASLERDWLQYRKELIQVAAVAVAALESYDRQLEDKD